MPRPTESPRIYVLAGTNGAGKSSIGGAMFASCGITYFNPDQAAVQIRAADESISQRDAEAIAWREGERLLQRAIAEHLNYAFETTLGGNTITALLDSAADTGIEVRIWYVGLDSPERHIARVQARVAKGGHDIPEERIRERYARSLLNLVRLMPKLAELRLFDNSVEGDPQQGMAPEPRLILHLENRRIRAACELDAAPEWSKPILLAALQMAST